MKPTFRRLDKILVATLASISLMLCAYSAMAQQDRQLVQTDTPRSANARRVALVIGNGAYTSAPPLKNPPNDARDMAATLRSFGFEVTTGINVNQHEMKQLMRQFGQQLRAGGSGLFYYAGHGVQSKGRNYLIPIDADIQSEVEAEDAGVDISLVLGYMDDAQNELNIVILDACRNNPFARNFRSASSGLAQVDAPTGTLIAYATAPGRVASDGTGRNGLYTSELLRVMDTPGLSVEEVFKRVRANVRRETNGQQIPWESSSLVGDFSFTTSNSSASKDSPSTNRPTAVGGSGVAVNSTSVEISYWDTVKNSTDAKDVRTYLEKYPNGQFAVLAKNRLATLEAGAKEKDAAEATRHDAVELGNQLTVIPAPDGFEEAASQFEAIRNQFSRTEAAENDMLAVHLPHADCDKLRLGEALSFNFYTKVSIRKINRDQDHSAERFADLVAAFRKTSTEVLDINGPTLKNAVQQLDKAMSEMNKKETKLSLSQPVNLGEFDTRPNVYGVILLVTVSSKSGDREVSVPLVGGLTYLRVKQRLLYVYTYRRYNSANDVQVVRDFTRQWISKILAAN